MSDLVKFSFDLLGKVLSQSEKKAADDIGSDNSEAIKKQSA